MSHPFLARPDQMKFGHLANANPFGDRLALLTDIEVNDPRDLQDLLDQACADLGGALLRPNPRGWGPHRWELSVMGILGTGDTVEQAARD